MYEYRAVVINNYDGDTLRMNVDLGFGVKLENQPFRVYGINAPEIGAVNGTLAKEYVSKLLPKGTDVVITTLKDKREKYGRYLAKIILPNGQDLSSVMIAEGFATPYFG